MGSASSTVLLNGIQNMLETAAGPVCSGFVELGLSPSVHADLPDFTELVKQNEAAVVNISTVGEQPDRRNTGVPNDPRLEEFYRFFGRQVAVVVQVTVGLPIPVAPSAADSLLRKTVTF